jgi:hypothetical protein
MRMNITKSIVASLAFAAAIVLAAVPQTTTPDAKNPKGDMKADCQAMMAKKQEMQDKLKTMDATLDKLVAEMNAAGAENKAGAMEKPMAAVINELVAQRKAMRSMMMEMQGGMMSHMMGHMHSQHMKGAMHPMSDCPMMKMGGKEGCPTKPKGDEKK